MDDIIRKLISRNYCENACWYVIVILSEIIYELSLQFMIGINIFHLLKISQGS